MVGELQLKNITKAFDSVIANRDVTLTVRPNEIHAIVGENGAGKTTLMNIMYGLLRPDQGQIVISGQEVHLRGVHDAIRAAIGMVHQHFMLVPTLSVLENVILGKEAGSLVSIDRKKALNDIRGLLLKFGLNIDVNQPVENIVVGVQQKVEIMKALYRGADILILDEPTAVLTPQEIEELFRLLRAMIAEGKTIVFISHKLNEVMEIADTITVMRKGEVIDTVRKTETNPTALARMMTGREVVFAIERAQVTPGDPILVVEEVRTLGEMRETVLDGLSLEVRSGEIFGVAGVEGNGQHALYEILSGLRRVESGSVRINGEEIANTKSWKLRNQSIGRIPEDRQKTGLLLESSIEDNLLLGKQDSNRFSSRGFLNRKRIGESADHLMERFDIRASGRDVLVGKLSGGNQQKVILAREIGDEPNLILAHQPTRGLDIGSIEYVHRSLLAAREKNNAVVLISSELSEILKLADRIGVMYQGRIVSVIPVEEATREKLGFLMLGGKESEGVDLDDRP
jgi:general nucleoside transport system ATP-binding protein